MSGRTGLDDVSVALLDAIDLLLVDEPVRCSDVLAAVAALHGGDPSTTWPMLLGLGLPWRRHLPLVELYGSCGAVGGDPPADASAVEARLSEYGSLALAAERGETGPIPLGLVEGSWTSEGPVPSFAPAAVVGALLAGGADAGPPVMPGGGTVEGDVEALLLGEPVRLTLGCTIRPEGGNLVITELPIGVTVDQVLQAVADRGMRYEDDADGRRTRLVRRRSSPVVGIYDETTARDGLRILVRLVERSDLLLARDWLRAARPVTFEIDARLPEPMAQRLATWDRGDGSGLRALADLLGGPTAVR